MVLFTIFESLKRGAVSIGSYFQEKTLIFIIMSVVALFGWEAMGKMNKKSQFSYPFPLLFVIVMYGIYSAMFAPVVYSEVFDSIEISLGPATVRYFTFYYYKFFFYIILRGLDISKNKVW